MTPKELLRQLIPPLAIEGYRFLRSKRHRSDSVLSGDYASWRDATAASSGYDSQVILEKTEAALLEVRSGHAAHERDSILFDEIQYSWPMLAGLMWVGGLSKGNLNVLDFGGSLGTSYFQNRAFLSHLPGVRWNIVEQPRYVAVGKQKFEDGHLRFYDSIQACLSDTSPNVLLLSGVLQYLEHPYEVLNELLGFPGEHVIIDRTPFWDGARHRLCVQHVPPGIYPASYPSWIFSRSAFLRHVGSRSFRVMANFPALDRLDGPVAFAFEGIIMTRIPKA